MARHKQNQPVPPPTPASGPPPPGSPTSPTSPPATSATSATSATPPPTGSPTPTSGPTADPRTDAAYAQGRTEGRAEERHHEQVRDERADEAPVDPVHDRFGGVNVGASFFGWLVAVAVAILLTGIVGAIAAAVGDDRNITQSDVDRQAGTIGLTAAIVLLVVLMIGYYAGGYVAGRMSRFDGGRQGLAVWVIGLVITLVAVGLGAIFGSQYNALDRVDLPGVNLSDNEIGLGVVITIAAILVGTLVAAWLGGAVGRRYHSRVDKAIAKDAERKGRLTRR